MAYFFRLPKREDLTDHQQMALEEINPIAISGGAGTGKTVVSLWRHTRNIEDFNKYSVLVTFTKTLGFYLKMSAQTEEQGEKYKNSIPPSQQIFNLKDFPFNQNWRVHEIIIDEAQDLSYQTLINIRNHTDQISYGADFRQQLYSGTVTKKEIEELFPSNTPIELLQNFRNTYFILNFVKSILIDFYIPQDSLDELEMIRRGLKPILFITNDNFEKELEKIVELINQYKSNTHNIAILLPFGDSRYDFEQSVDKYHKALSDKGIDCSKYYNEMHIDNITIENIHITTFKSAKGLEFDTVLIPQLHKFRNNIKNAYTVNEEDYYVALTRTKTNLYLFSPYELDFINHNSCEIETLNNSHYNENYTSEIEIDEDEIPF